MPVTLSGLKSQILNPQKIVAAISSAQKNAKVMASPNLRFEFFKQSNLLGTVNRCVSCFGIDGTQYVDSSGMLEAVSNEYRKK